MALKKFVHKEIETCGITNKPIDTKSEKWVALIEYQADKQQTIKYYKSEYLVELINGQKTKIAEDLTDKIQLKANEMFKSIMSSVNTN